MSTMVGKKFLFTNANKSQLFLYWVSQKCLCMKGPWWGRGSSQKDTNSTFRSNWLVIKSTDWGDLTASSHKEKFICTFTWTAKYFNYYHGISSSMSTFWESLVLWPVQGIFKSTADSNLYYKKRPVSLTRAHRLMYWHRKKSIINMTKSIYTFKF